VSNPHFTLLTDLDREQAETSAAGLEQLRTAMLQAGWGLKSARFPRLTVVGFRSTRELREFADWKWNSGGIGYGGQGSLNVANIESYKTVGLASEPMVVLRAEGRLIESDAAIEALATYAAEPVPRRLPWWMTMGLDLYLSHGRVHDDAFIVGESLRSLPRTEVATQARIRGLSKELGGNTWKSTLLLVQYLRANQPRGFEDFCARLLRGEPEVSAFAASFPGLDADTIDAGLRSLNEHPVGAVRTVPLPTVAPTPKTEELSPAEVHATWAVLFEGPGPNRDEKRGEEERRAALALDPQNVTALLEGVPKRGPARLDGLRALRDAHPGDPRPCQQLLRVAAAPEDERLACADRAVQVDPDDGQAQAARVISLLRLGRVEQAAEALAEADQLLPADGQLLSLLAQAQADAGRCSAALDSVARLEELAAGKKASPEVARFIGQIRERCGGR
jgi:hypothetical protein